MSMPKITFNNKDHLFFAARNKMISWLVGRVNFQIEHHLLPHISHVHYLALSKIIQKQCELFGLPYNY
jgi:linoleoyl-CoA desaturase